MENSELYKVTPEMLEKRPLSYSSLKEFRKSPKHWIHYRTEPRKEIPAFALGSAIETLLLESADEFNKHFMVADKPNLRTKAGKAEWEAIQEQAKMDEQWLISSEQYENAKNAAKAVLNTHEAEIFLRNKTQTQRKLRWNDKQTGLPIIGYSDFETNIGETEFVVDLKTTGQSAQPDDFNRTAAKFGYDLQIGAYLLAYHKKFFRFPEFLFLVVETTPPYGVAPIRVDKDEAEQFKAEFQGVLKAFKLCMEKQKFYMSYEFFLYEMKPYFELNLPKYHKLNFAKL